MIAVRAAHEHELTELEQIVRLAFAAQLCLPSPEAFGDRALIVPRWRADPTSVLVAEVDGHTIGSNVATVWGRLGWFGPLTVHPDYWNGGVAQALLRATMERFAAHDTSAEALFTLASSPKHLSLYQRYGFWPRRLSVVLTLAPTPKDTAFSRWSALTSAERRRAGDAVATLANGLFAGLDVSGEIRAVALLGIGETLLVPHADGPVGGFAICHHGLGSEAGSGTCAVKFGAAADERSFGALLDAVVAYGAELGAQRVALVINTARERAYRTALAAGFTIAMVGVAMVRGGAVYDHADAWVLEDHR